MMEGTTMGSAKMLLAAAADSVNAQLAKWDEFRDYIFNPELWNGILMTVIKIIVFWFAGRIVVKLLNKAFEHMSRDRERVPIKFDPRRTRTISRLFSNVVSYTVNFILILLVLGELGFNLGPLLAGAGVIGLAIGFGAQSLVKDVITGFFIIFEDQFAVGDVIQVGTLKGTVEQIGLRVTRIRSGTGEEHIIPNGAIGQVTNYSVHNSLAIVDVPIPYGEDAERAMRIIKDTVGPLSETVPEMVTVPQVLGVQTIGPAEIVLRVTATCMPNTDAAVVRILNTEIKKALDAHGFRK